MWVIDSGAPAWTQSLDAFATSPEKRSAMRDAAAAYSREHLASWRDVLAEDFYPVWCRAVNSAKEKAAA
ncbi:hypothetical protein D3C83_206610 [compost metagenome]